MLLSKNKFLKRVLLKYGHRLGTSRFVAGNDIETASNVIRLLNQKGFSVTVDYLGEFVDNTKEAIRSAKECMHAIEVIAKKNLDSEVSVKLTSIGLDLSKELVMENMHHILRAGKKHGVTVTIDMEDYTRYERTIAIYKELKQQYDNIGTVLQAYLYRAEEDMLKLNLCNPYLRLVKGAYKESAEIAYPKKEKVDDNFKRLIHIQLLTGNYTAIATHDEQIINDTLAIVKKNNIQRHLFEFQMLYGIRPELQKRLVDEGYKVRVYVPYGEDWYGYNMRRLAERPANIWFILKNLFKK